ncbi:helix-turn-helix domain-containing protein [Streptomyces sp. NPDC048442]|uniref:helix-turn-helix domain-containing protein n=1 Tax=Streptomyces sp. NPDC048442 TaxID=3154823 RepID=UPI00341EC1F6
MTPVDRRTPRPAREPVAARASTDVPQTSTGLARTPAAVVAQASAGTDRTPPDGLSRHAQRTLACLQGSGAQGATTEALSEAVGFTARTVAKHLDGLSRCGLVAQREDGRWSAAAPGPGPAPDPDQDSVPGPAPRGATLPAQQDGRADQPSSRRAAAVRPEEMQAAMPTPS